MDVQLIFIVLFILNMASVWSTEFLKKCEWYRVVGIVVFAVIPFLTVFFEQPHFELDYFSWRIAGVVGLVLGLGIVIWSRFNLNLQQEVITAGPYQYVRHPQYLGLIFMWVGWWWVWAAVYSFYFGMVFLALAWIEAYLEEKLILEKQFGDQYREYKRQTGMFWIK